MSIDDVIALADLDSQAVPPLSQHQADYTAALLTASRQPADAAA